MSRAVCILMLVWACSSVTSAQPAADDGNDYDRWITVALEAFERGEIDRAREAFDHAHRIEPSARTWRGLGTADFKAGRFPEAFVELDAALREERRPLPPELHAAVQSLLGQVRANVAVCEIVGAPAGALIFVDGGAPVRDAQGRVVLAKGRHLLRLEATGYESATIELDPAVGGAVERVHVPLRPAQPPDPHVERSDEDNDGAPDARRESMSAPEHFAAVPATAEPSTSRKWTWVAAAGVPLFAAAAGISWVRTQDIGDGIADRCERDRCTSAQRGALIAESPLATFETLTNVALALAGASLVATGVAFVVEGNASEDKTQLTVVPTGLSITRSF